MKLKNRMMIGSAAVLLSIAVSYAAFTAIETTAARYRTGSAGETAVRVAKMRLDVTDPVLKSPDEILDCNLDSDAIIYEMEVRNRSEVDMDFQVSTSGQGENITVNIVPETGELAANSGSETVTVTLSVTDPEKRVQQEEIDSFSIIVSGAQKGETE